MTFARHAMILLLASASLMALAQESVPAKPRPAQTQSDESVPPPKPHLMVSHPVVKPPVPAAQGTAATPKLAATKPPAATPAALPAQQTAGPFNRTVVVLDPGHGGGDTGSRINDQLTEKDVTLALAFKIRSLLAARGFTVAMTRDSDNVQATPGAPLSLDDRAGIANRARPVACLLLHATASGKGVHLYTSELEATAGEAVPTPWLTAQAAWASESRKLAEQLGTALGRGKIPLVTSRASVRPVDSLTCPAIVVELAPNGSDAATLNDGSYQQRVAEAIAGALVFWQNLAKPPIRLTPIVPPTPTATSEVHP